MSVEPASPSGPEARILFVDDEPNILLGLRSRLRAFRRRWDMEFAESAAAALVQLQQRGFDIVVSDMRMPEMNGGMLLAEVKRLRPNTARVILSGQCDEATSLGAVPFAHRFLSKPCQSGELEGLLQEMIALRRRVPSEPLRTRLTGLTVVSALSTLEQQLQGLAASNQLQPETVARVLEQDPTMCGRILQVCSSAFFGQGRRVSSITTAVEYLGSNLVLSLVRAIDAVAVRTAAAESPASLDLHGHALTVARLARRLVADQPARAEPAFTAGLLHDIGALMLEPGELEVDAARDRDGRAASAYLLGMWGLADEIVEAVARPSDELALETGPLSCAAAVRIADWIAHDSEGTAAPPEWLLRRGLSEQLARWRGLARLAA